jgi:F0F1-type ATP synthase epsilon subunit
MEDIDPKRAKEAMERAEKRLADERAKEEIDRARARAALERAVMRLKIAALS